MLDQNLSAELQHEEGSDQATARTVTSPECLSASVLTICQSVDHGQIKDMVGELRRQSAAVHDNDLSRAESMLTAQAHTLDGLFARLAANALTCAGTANMERYMRLALKAQSQARATLQTLGELKAPKQVAFVQQANIGNQVQVNNDSNPSRTRKNKNPPNELLEVNHGKRLDTRAPGKAGGADPAMAAVDEKHRAPKR
jgi:hypothetical protein